MFNIRSISTEYRLILAAMFSPTLAFFLGYKLLNQKLLLLLSLISVFLYGFLVYKNMWVTFLQLNICYTGFYYVGCYPFSINRAGLIALKILMTFAVLVSPIYILSLIPESLIEFIFSGVLIFSGLLLIWAGKRASKLMQRKFI